MCIRMARRTNSCCSSHPVMMYEMDLKKQFPSPLMDLTEAGTVRGMWRLPGAVLLDSQYIRPMFSHVTLCHSSFIGWDKCRPVNYHKFQFHGFQLTEQEMVWDMEKVAIATVMVLMGEENHPKSQCYGFEQEIAVDEEKVVMVVATEDRMMVGIAVHWMSC